MIRPFMHPLPAETVPLAYSNGRILRETIRADRPYPPLNRVCMDGIAIKYADWVAMIFEFKLSGVGRAGEPPRKSAGSSTAIEVMTGAPCPEGCDTIIPVENLDIRNGIAKVLPKTAIRFGQNIQPKSSDCAEGDIVIPEGSRMNAARAAVAASVGKGHVQVTRLPRIKVIYTGDEIVDCDSKPESWQVRRSNSTALAAMVSGLVEAVEMRWAADDPMELERLIQWGITDCDMLVLSGGVSAGKYDFVPGTLEKVGVVKHFHKLAMRPGKPIWFGSTAAGQPVFGLPGNPVSFLVCFRRFTVPVLNAMAGQASSSIQATIRLGDKIRPLPGMTLFLPVTVTATAEGIGRAHPSPTNGSGDFFGLGKSDGFIEIDPGAEFIAIGKYVPYFPWES